MTSGTPHDMPFGARLQADGGAYFALWAPAAQAVELLHAETAQTSKQAQTAVRGQDGWWRAHRADAAAGLRYQWRIDGTNTVPDPASRSNPDGPHHASVLAAATPYAWQTPWKGQPWNALVFYELHVGTFTPAGTYVAATEHLARLAELGFTAIELMPLATYGGNWGWGYDGVLPFAPHPAYGTPDDLRRFVDEAHALGLSVFVDVVYNHFGPDGNYLHCYAPTFFSHIHNSPWGAAINFDQEGSGPVRDFFVQNALYWIEEFRMDGLRLDAIHAIVDDTQPDILQEISTRVRAAASQTGRSVHLVLENERNQPSRLSPAPTPGKYDAQWNDDFHHALHVALTGESQGYYGKFARDPMALLARVLTHGFAFADGSSAPAGPPVPLTTLVQFIGNHDQIGNRAFGERLAQLVSAESVELALLLSLLSPAAPMVFMGDEFGAMTPFLYFANWDGELRDAVRQGRQREFAHAVPPGGQLPDPCDVASMNASRLDWREAQSAAGRARSDLVQRALQARRTWLQPRADRLQIGEHTAEAIGTRGLRVAWHYAGDTTVRLEINLSAGALPVTPLEPPPGIQAQVVFAHRWAEAEKSWAPWSARWTLLEALP